jgi:hypothetical protein
MSTSRNSIERRIACHDKEAPFLLQILADLLGELTTDQLQVVDKSMCNYEISRRTSRKRSRQASVQPELTHLVTNDAAFLDVEDTPAIILLLSTTGLRGLVFDLIDTRSHFMLSAVSKSARKAAGFTAIVPSLPCIWRKRIHLPMPMTYAAMNRLLSSTLHSFTDVVLKGDMLKPIGELVSLVRLDVMDLGYLLYEGPSVPQPFPSLHTLIIRNSKLSDDDLGLMGLLPSLRKLGLSGCGQIHSKGIEQLFAGATKLRGLVMDDITPITQRALWRHAEGSTLVLLGICSLFYRVLISIEAVTRVPSSIRSLVLSRGFLSTASLSLIGSSELRKLDLSNCMFKSGEDFRHFLQLRPPPMLFTTIQTLDVSLIRLSSATIIALCTATKGTLTHLNISDCNVTDEGCLSIRTMSKLKTLNISHCPSVSILGVIALANLALHSFVFTATTNVESIVLQISTMNSIRKLDLSLSVDIRDHHLKSLTQLHNLELLVVKGCEHITTTSLVCEDHTVTVVTEFPPPNVEAALDMFCLDEDLE